jgi:hypothetical protein
MIPKVLKQKNLHEPYRLPTGKRAIAP